jgi:uncharacterized membrane protein YagU involved in acid resistance
VVKGAAAGALAAWAMGKVTTLMQNAESPEARRRYEEVTGGKYVTDRGAERIESALGLTLTKPQHQALATSQHWIVGLAAGAAFALVRHRIPASHRGHGLLFGLGFWLAFDEVFTVAAGLAEPPQVYPWQAHARGLAGHAVYGMVADGVLHALDRAA